MYGENLPAYGSIESFDAIEIRFDSLSASGGLALTVSAPGDKDGQTTLSNTLVVA